MQPLTPNHQLQGKHGTEALVDVLRGNMQDFAKFLASQPNADSLKKEFDRAYHLARYEVKLSKTQNGQWVKVSEWISDSSGLSDE